MERQEIASNTGRTVVADFPITLASVQPVRRQHETITLLPAETLLRELLLDCREHIKRSQVSAASDLEIWITGGWVRDRLLGIPCSDIDIALNTMTGKQFGLYLTEFFTQNKEQYRQRAAQLGVEDSPFSSFHTTKKNLSKSKKLETTSGKVFGLDLDLVNLRKEVYEDDNRTPEMEFGTADEDAFRRDATINALFFHLERQQVVDFTGKGLDDMAAGFVRTPLEPRQTFLDDPLRVLRLIRIGSKLGYAIDEEAKTWMKDEEIHAALDAKVSRERIGIEIFKMMRIPNPQIAFHLLFQVNLYAVVFLGLRAPSLHPVLQGRLPAQDLGQPWPNTWPRAYQALATLFNDKKSELGRMVQSEKQVDNLWTMAAYAPISELRHSITQSTLIGVLEAVRATHDISKLLGDSLRNLDSIRTTIALVVDNPGSPLSRSSVGMKLRSWGPTWKLQVIYSLLAELVYRITPIPSSHASLYTENDADLEKILEYNVFVKFVFGRGLQDVCLLKPLLDGNAIMKLFGVAQGGSFLKFAIEELIAWQLDHEGFEIEAAKEWLYQQRDRLNVSRRNI